MSRQWLAVIIVVSIASRWVVAYPIGCRDCCVENSTIRPISRSEDNWCKNVYDRNKTSYFPAFESTAGRRDWIGYLDTIPLLIVTAIVFYLKKRIDRTLRELIPDRR